MIQKYSVRYIFTVVAFGKVKRFESFAVVVKVRFPFIFKEIERIGVGGDIDMVIGDLIFVDQIVKDRTDIGKILNISKQVGVSGRAFFLFIDESKAFGDIEMVVGNVIDEFDTIFKF